MRLWTWLAGHDSRYEGSICAQAWLEQPDEIDLSTDAVQRLYDGEDYNYDEFVAGFREEVRRHEPTTGFFSRFFGG